MHSRNFVLSYSKFGFQQFKAAAKQQRRSMRALVNGIGKLQMKIAFNRIST
jgi:hypothetical protein